MQILYTIIKHLKEQEGQMIFAYLFATFATVLLLWHIIDKIIAFSALSPDLQFIFT
mgnify:CR=1 FL=1